MASTLTIAKWFVSRSHREQQLNGGLTLTHLPLQKLIYYAQGWHLAVFGEKLFAEDLEAWQHGPVSPSVYRAMKQYNDTPIPLDIGVQSDRETVSPATELLLESVWQRYGSATPRQLVDGTHAEPPWKNARKGLALNDPSRNIISSAEMQLYFQGQADKDRIPFADPAALYQGEEDAAAGRLVDGATVLASLRGT